LHPAGFFTSASTAEKFIATSPSLLINIKNSSRPNPKAATSSVTSEIAFPTKDSLAAKRLRRSDQDGVRRTLTQNEYLAAENRILRAKLSSRLRLSDPERATLAEIGRRLGRTALRAVACVAKPDTILAWYRRLVAKKFDGSKHRQCPGRPAVAPEVEALVVRMARENTGWGYDRIVGALTN
jgi:hypothetical protein